MKKLIVLLMTIFALSFCFSGFVSVQAASTASINKKADKKFTAKVKMLKNKNTSSIIFYKYKDITGNGVHELLVEYKPETMGGSGSLFEVYSYKNGSLKKILSLDQYGLSKCIYYHKTKALILYGSGHGGEWYRYYQLKNGKYKYIAEKARVATAGGGLYDGEWAYYKGSNTSTTISSKKFKKLTSKLSKGKKRSFSNWNILD